MLKNLSPLILALITLSSVSVLANTTIGRDQLEDFANAASIGLSQGHWDCTDTDGRKLNNSEYQITNVKRLLWWDVQSGSLSKNEEQTLVTLVASNPGLYHDARMILKTTSNDQNKIISVHAEFQRPQKLNKGTPTDPMIVDGWASYWGFSCK
jgi:hypothetical protein